MQRLSHVLVENFRSCKFLELPLAEFTPLVGYNNAGKSNVVAAIKWLLAPWALRKEDFFDETKPVVVSGRIEGITGEVLDLLEENHRGKIEPFCPSGRFRFRYVQESPGGGKTAYQLLVRDPQVENEEADNAWRKNPTGIPGAVKKLFPDPIHIEAMQNVPEDLAKAKSGSTIQGLVKEIADPIVEAHGSDLQASLDAIAKKLTASGEDRAEELVEFDRSANEHLRSFFPNLNIRLDVASPALPDLIKSGNIEVKESGYGDWQDFRAVGHGAQRTIQMALIQYLAELKAKSGDGVHRRLLLVDEPELYLHPQAIEQVRLAFRTLAKKGYQVVFSTHSPLMLHQEEIASTVIVRKDATGSLGLKPLRSAVEGLVEDAPSQTRTLYEFSNSAQIFFSDRVLVAEGVTEKTVIPELYRAIRQKTLGQAKTALVELGGSGSIHKILPILHSMHLPAVALADLDYAFKMAPSVGWVPPDHEDIQAAKDIFARLAPDHGIELGDDGFPKKSGALTAAEAFCLLAEDNEGREIAQRMHSLLKTKGIWLWTRGAIEDHLGLERKNEKARRDFCFDVQAEDADLTNLVPDLATVRAFFDWLEEAAVEFHDEER